MNEADLISEIIALVICPPCFLLTAYWLRKAARYNRITRKLHAHEPLTEQEQRMLDKARP